MNEQLPQPWETWHAHFDYSEGRGYKFRPVIESNNAAIRDLIHYHRGMKIDRHIKAGFWWCYLSP